MSKEQDGGISRRDVVTKLGAGIAGAVVGSAMQSEAQGGVGQSRGGNTAAPFVDPTAKYPKPPYDTTQQPWPGLASKMQPPPDHGEKSYKGSGRLAGRKALITGGDSGIGRGAAIAYAREGADVAIVYYPSEEPDAKEVGELVKAEGRKFVAIPGDLRKEEFSKSVVEKAVKELGGLDILVSNAARQTQSQTITDITDEIFDSIIKTNIYAPFWIIRAAVPRLQPGSSIIATASEQAYDPNPDLYAYAQTKAATMNFVKSLAKMLGPKGIRVNGVAPGPIYTPLQISGGATVEHFKNFGADYPIARAGQPVELASVFVQLAANDASYTTGNIYGVGGGKGQP
jgi:NAD(P)-dependent dehydrogenase (short-subunit alcohol dehydrogenase family)